MKRKFLIICCLIMALAGCALAEVTPMPTLASGQLDLLAVDHKLYELGYRDSACTGVLNDVMVNALKNFQTANGLEATGEPDGETVILLLSGGATSQQDYISGLALEHSRKAVLANGSYGEDVAGLQQALKDLGYFSGECDGAYGRATEEAVYRFQLANGLQETGVADRSVYLRISGSQPVSWNDFLQQSCASAGETGAHVRRIQIWLKHKNHFFGACTGRYGDGTQQAVKRFQAANELETSGDVDLATCTALFSDVTGMLGDVKAVRRGETGAEVSRLHQALSSLGYPSQEQFGMQTELAVMQFQLVNGISVTGVADSVTLSRISHPNVRARGDFSAENAVIAVDDGLRLQLARQAASQLGQYAGFEDPFDFVSYVYLKCGLPLIQQEQLQVNRIEDRDQIQPGQVLFLTADGREICGIATADGAVVCQNQDGYIVMRYLDMMEVESIFGSGNGAGA